MNMSLYPIEHIDTIQHSHITHLRNCALVLLGYTVIGNTRQGCDDTATVPLQIHHIPTPYRYLLHHYISLSIWMTPSAIRPDKLCLHAHRTRKWTRSNTNLSTWMGQPFASSVFATGTGLISTASSSRHGSTRSRALFHTKLFPIRGVLPKLWRAYK